MRRGRGGGGILVCVISTPIILFRTLLRMRTQLGIPFRGTKIEENSRNSVQNHSAEDKPTQNKTRQPNISKIVSEKMTFDVQNKSFCSDILLLFRKTNIFRGIPFRSVPFRASELALPRNSECLGMNAFFSGITEIVPSLFRGFFSERNSVQTLGPPCQAGGIDSLESIPGLPLKSLKYHLCVHGVCIL
jgi:hypothetical protein